MLTIPLRITFRDMAPSTFVEEYVRARAEKLESFARHITNCHVTIALPHRHRHGSHPHVSIELAVRGKCLVANRDREDEKRLQDVNACVDHAFDEARRVLVDHIRTQQSVRHAEAAR